MSSSLFLLEVAKSITLCIPKCCLLGEVVVVSCSFRTPFLKSSRVRWYNHVLLYAFFSCNSFITSLVSLKCLGGKLIGFPLVSVVRLYSCCAMFLRFFVYNVPFASAKCFLFLLMMAFLMPSLLSRILVWLDIISSFPVIGWMKVTSPYTSILVGGFWSLVVSVPFTALKCVIAVYIFL